VWTDIGKYRSRDYGRVLLAKLGKEAGGEGGKGWVYMTRSGAYGVVIPIAPP
jgi:hypothetical protein